MSIAQMQHRARPPPARAGQVLVAAPDNSFAAVPKGVRGIEAESRCWVLGTGYSLLGSVIGGLKVKRVVYVVYVVWYSR
jgi:hypothetical protein